jgi:hypothetical protein
MLITSTYPLNASWVLRILLCSLHCLAVTALFFTVNSACLLWLMIVVVLGSLLLQLNHLARLQKLILSGNQIQLILLDLQVIQAEVLASTTVTPYAIFLHLKHSYSEKKSYRLIMFDAMSKQDFRHLRIAFKLRQTSFSSLESR